MAYQQITPSTLPGLIDSIRSFAVTNGFTTSGYVYTSGGERFAAVTLNGIGYVFTTPVSGLDYIDFNSTDDWPPSGTPDLLELSNHCPKNGGVRLDGAVPLNAYLFNTANAIHCMIEKSSGAFVYLGFGELSDGSPFMQSLRPYGTTETDWRHADHIRPFDGLDYDGSGKDHSGHVRLSYDGKNFATFGYGDDDFTELRGTPLFVSPEGARIVDVTPNAVTGSLVVDRIDVVLKRKEPFDNLPQFWVPVGQVPGMGFVNIRDNVPDDVVLTGWHVFPMSAQNFDDIANGTVDTVNIGLAFEA